MAPPPGGAFSWGSIKKGHPKVALKDCDEAQSEDSCRDI